MASYPQSVDLNQAEFDRLTRAYQAAYKQIYDEIANASEFGIVRRRAILAQIKQTLTDLGVETDRYINDVIPVYYELGANQAVGQLKALDVPIAIKTGFNRIHKEAIQALVSDTARSFGDAISTVNRSAISLMSQATKMQIQERLAVGQVTGDALRTIQKRIISDLEDQGITALTDKAGKEWALDTYTEMLIRTKTVEARNSGLQNRLIENGYDLVQVSAHGASDVCADWEGEVLSMTGATAGFPTVDEAEGDGLFHPNCRHALNALTPELADEAMNWNSVTQQYQKGLIPNSNYQKPVVNT